MNPQETLLWSKIAAFELDDPNADFPFSHRLARDNGWTKTYAKQVVAEYKKFVFLCCISDRGATPSDQVDQAWHLHLTYTKSYWIDLCKNTIEREIHHNPTKGGEQEGHKFNDFYMDTLRLYRSKFGCEPPANIWPENEKRFSDVDFQRVNSRNHWIIPRRKLNRNKLVILAVVVFGLLSIQAEGLGAAVTPVAMIVIIGFLLLYLFKNSGGGSGCSGSGCSGCGGD